MSAQIGLLGLGVIGRALAQNLGRQGAVVHGFDPSPAARAGAAAEGVRTWESPAALAVALAPPRTILLLVPAGATVDAGIAELRPGLAGGDIVADCGNSHYLDTIRRERALAADGILFLGVGVSGGEAGARSGPAIMAGGPPEAWVRLRPLLEGAAARFAGAPCCARVGPDGAGHFVKMVHNGIEYAVMQLIAESFDLLHRVGGLSHTAIADCLDRWSEGELGSYLLEITAAVLRLRDPEGGGPFVELIDDAAGQKGTGAWASMAALELGVPVPVLVEAVLARGVSGRKADRAAVARTVLPAAASGALPPERLREALLAGVIVAYAQGFDLLRAAAAARAWPLDRAAVARLWRAGCIIRAKLLEPIATALAMLPDDAPLLAAAEPGGRVSAALPGLRATVATAALAGVPVPCLGAALASVEALTAPRLPTRLIQAQRDHFGRHGFARIDRAGQQHLPETSR